MSSNLASQRKVRVACQRCRARRIRCDGTIPACTNCAKAGVACVDVDGRNSDQLVPRNFASSAKSRIEWLEEIVKTHIPTFDLNSGPQVDLSNVDSGGGLQIGESGHLRPTHSKNGTSQVSTASDEVFSNAGASKRTHSSLEESGGGRDFTSEARSVAIDLGMLSLNSDSRQKHYLGASSGLLFSHLIQADFEETDRSQIRETGGPSNTTGVRQTRVIRTSHAKQDFQQFYDLLSANLPAKEDALFLLDTYFRHAHPDHPIMHIPSVVNALNALYYCSHVGTTASVDAQGWPTDMPSFRYNGELHSIADVPSTPISLPTAMFHVFMIFTLAATLKSRGGDFEFAPAQFYRIVMTVSRDALAETTIPSLQAVYLLAIHSFMAPAKLNIWTLIHLCMAHAIDLGIHREPGDISKAAANTRRLLFHSIYSLDRSVSTIQGRPLCIRDETFDVNVPLLEHLETDTEIDEMPPELKPLCTGTMRYVLHRFRLDRIISDIKLLLYRLPIESKSIIWPPDLAGVQTKLHTELNSWYEEVAIISTQLKVVEDSLRKKWQFKLQQQYHAAIVLLFQPSQVFRHPTDDAFLRCFNSAIQQLRYFDALYESDSLHPGWRPIHSIFASGATIIYCFWTSKAVQSSPLVDTMPQMLRLCLTLLGIGGVWWPSVKKGKASFERLVDLTMKKYNQRRNNNNEEHARKRQSRIRAQPQNPPTSSSTVPNQTFPDNFNALPSTENPFTLSHLAMSGNHVFDINQSPMANISPIDINWTTIDNVPLENSPHNLTTDMSMPNETGEMSMWSPQTQVSSNVDPEIEAFLADYFLNDENTWNLSTSEAPLSFHFGDL